MLIIRLVYYGRNCENTADKIAFAIAPLDDIIEILFTFWIHFKWYFYEERMNSGTLGRGIRYRVFALEEK